MIKELSPASQGRQRLYLLRLSRLGHQRGGGGGQVSDGQGGFTETSGSWSVGWTLVGRQRKSSGQWILRRQTM